jgi:hypothetical protein
MQGYFFAMGNFNIFHFPERPAPRWTAESCLWFPPFNAWMPLLTCLPPVAGEIQHKRLMKDRRETAFSVI